MPNVKTRLDADFGRESGEHISPLIAIDTDVTLHPVQFQFHVYFGGPAKGDG